MPSYEKGSIEESIEDLVMILTVVPEELLKGDTEAIAEMKQSYKNALCNYSKAIIDEMVKEVIKQTDGKILVTRQ